MSRVITVDRTVPFCPSVVGRGTLLVVPQNDRLLVTKVTDLSKIRLTEFTGADWQANKDIAHHLDAKVAEAIFQASKTNPGIIPGHWRPAPDGEDLCIFFCGTELVCPRSGECYAVILYWLKEKLSLGYHQRDCEILSIRKFAALI